MFLTLRSDERHEDVMLYVRVSANMIAKALGISVGTVHRLIKEGKSPAVKLLDRRVLIPRATLIKVLGAPNDKTTKR